MCDFWCARIRALPLFFERTFLQLQVKEDQGGSRSRCQLQSTAAGDASRTGREAAGLRSLLPASACQELVQGWWRASSTKLRLEGELQESRSERTLRRNGDEASPAENPGGLVADSSRGTCCTRTGKEANKGGSFLSPAARFESENDKATASASVDLGVCLPSLAPRSIAVGAAHRGPAHRCSWRPARRCARLAPPGSAGDGAFEGQCSGGEHAGCGACSSMVCVRIEHAAAGAAVRAKREGHAQAAQEHDAEV